MALFIRQDEQRSKLQERIATEMQERAKQRAIDNDPPDGVDDARFIEHTKRSSSLALVWAIIFILVIVGFIFFVILNYVKS
jgi:preprotein translocase subunit SecF